MSTGTSYCRKCGATLAADDAFCAKCGTPHSATAEAPEEARKKSSAGTIGCGALILIFIALSVSGALSGGDDNPSSSSSRAEQMMPMRGSVIVFDQRTCSSGARIKVSVGPIWQENTVYPDANAPCNLGIDIEVPPKADSYKIQVGNLPAVVLTPAEMREKDAQGNDYFEVKLIVGQ